MSDLAADIKEASKPKGEDASAAARAAAEAEAEEELSQALESRDVKRIRAALRAVRELDE